MVEQLVEVSPTSVLIALELQMENQLVAVPPTVSQQCRIIPQSLGPDLGQRGSTGGGWAHPTPSGTPPQMVPPPAQGGVQTLGAAPGPQFRGSSWTRRLTSM